jgi:hypothetical protein
MDKYNYNSREVSRMAFAIAYGYLKHKWSFAYICKWQGWSDYDTVRRAMGIWNTCDYVEGKVFKRGEIIYLGNPLEPKCKWQDILMTDGKEVWVSTISAML